METISAIAKELRFRMNATKPDNPYLLGRQHELQAILTMVEAIEMTKQCSLCREPLVVLFRENVGLVATCNDLDCGYTIELNQVGY